MGRSVVGIIGGSGLYDLPGLTGAEWRTVASPFGAPSDDLLFGTLADRDIVFLPRHGRGHRIPPSAINYRANIDALKRAGVTDLIAVSAVGSFRHDLPPGHFVLVDQFLDRTYRRETSFFGPGLVGHVGFGHPVSPGLVERLATAAQALNLDVAIGGTYVCIEGPHFSTLAESRFYKAAGCDVIGMTNVTEAKLAREAELPFATIAMVTDFDCWHPDHDHVDVAQVVRVMHDNAIHARQLVARFVADFPAEHPACPIGSDRALDTAVMTAPSARDPDLVAKLGAVAGRVLAS